MKQMDGRMGVEVYVECRFVVIPAQGRGMSPTRIQSVSEGETIARVEHRAVHSSPDSSRSIGHPGAGSGHVSDEDPVGA
jgi:hypothetical protein